MAYHGHGATAISRPTIGDVMVRTTASGQTQEAAILCIVETNKVFWKATMVTDSGYQFVTSDKEQRGINAWRPDYWVWSAEAGTYHDPANVWDNTRSRWVEPVDKSDIVPALLASNNLIPSAPLA